MKKRGLIALLVLAILLLAACGVTAEQVEKDLQGTWCHLHHDSEKNAAFMFYLTFSDGKVELVSQTGLSLTGSYEIDTSKEVIRCTWEPSGETAEYSYKYNINDRLFISGSYEGKANGAEGFDRWD